MLAPSRWVAALGIGLCGWVCLAQGAVTLDLGDIVAGGDGAGKGDRNTALNPRTGARVVGSAAELFEAGAFAVVDEPFVDVVFVPDGGHGPILISSTGLPAVQSEFLPAVQRDTDGRTWDYIAARPNFMSGASIGGINFADDMIGMHASKGITFDLDAIEFSRGLQAAEFRALAGNAGAGSADFAVLLDGVTAALQLNVTSASGVFPLSIPIPVGTRFLTLISTDGGDGLAGDEILFASPRIDLVPEPMTASFLLLGAACLRRRTVRARALA